MAKHTLSDLTTQDLETHPLWEMIQDPRSGDTVVKPVKRLPARTMMNRLAGTQVRLADGTRLWAILGNISLKNPLSTRHFLTLSIHHDGQWFDLARYHDSDFKRRNGDALARFLGKAPGEVFPIEYDISALVDGAAGSSLGKIQRVPDERLPQEQLMLLALQDG